MPRRSFRQLRVDQIVAAYKGEFHAHGEFHLIGGALVASAAKSGGNPVPKCPGVYLIYEERETTCILKYIGAAGTFKRKGKKTIWTQGGLLRRIVEGNHRVGQTRRQFYRSILAKRGVRALYFKWFATWVSESNVLPTKAEAELLQAYICETKTLPDWNRST